MKRTFSLACLLSLAIAQMSACESSQSMPAATPHWTYAKVSPDGTRVRANFRADDQGQIVYFTTEVQTPQGEHYFGQGTPSLDDVLMLKGLTTQAAIDALHPNLVLDDQEHELTRDLMAPAALQVSLWPQGCPWPVSEQCHQVLGSLSLTPKNPAVDRLDKFFVDFALRNKGVLASDVASFSDPEGQ